MKPTKAYIIRIDNEKSIEYAKTCSDSCDKIGLQWEYFEGVNFSKVKNQIWKHCKVKFQKTPGIQGAAAAATASHFNLWKTIADNDECAIILEHDALMLNPVDVDVPDNTLVVLGYKVFDPENYKVQSGKQKLEKREKHGGAHAYAINPTTAKRLVKFLMTCQNVRNIDNQFFLTNNQRDKIAMSIVDPIPAIGWLRDSTIWKKSAVDNYGPILNSFKNNYKSKQNLGVKNR